MTDINPYCTARTLSHALGVDVHFMLYDVLPTQGDDK